ncbi:ABC transporter [candidate division CPR3 bacterium 4484_211]|uniref:ABC transporter n=1 Tax=candidate division CPR3 bacterium 4484_211 TaxID=1968527 RepID=A0A1W9NYJ2_UNCC3|nr:MAG: ABC transporter [candidate division CPR3 bacterium 4484_211]
MNQFLLSLISGIFIGGAAGYLGSLMLSKRMALAAGPLGHLTLPGIALALIYGFDVSLGAFPCVILGIVLIWFLQIKTPLPMEALTAIVFSAGVAAAFLFLPIAEAEEALVGDISKVSLGDAFLAVFLCLTVFFLVKRIYPQLILVNISEDLARSEGVDVKKYNLLFLFCVAVIVALGVKIVGGLLTAALVAIPAATSRNLSRNLFRYKYGSVFFGGVGCSTGIFLSRFLHLPAGPLIILSLTLFFLLSLKFAKP